MKKLTSDESMVDRALIVKLLVQYFQKKDQRSDVLALIASILKFNEEEKNKCGLGVPVQQSACVRVCVCVCMCVCVYVCLFVCSYVSVLINTHRLTLQSTVPLVLTPMC